MDEALVEVGDWTFDSETDAVATKGPGFVGVELALFAFEI